MILTKAELAKKLRVSRSAITQAVNRGDLITDEDGKIDTADFQNARYLARLDERPRNRKPAPPVEQATDTDGTDLTPETVAKMPEGTLKKMAMAALIAQRRQAANRHEQARLKELGHLVERRIVDRLIGELGASLRQELVYLPKRVMPRLKALIRSGENLKAQALLEDEIAEAIGRAKAAAEKIGLKEF